MFVSRYHETGQNNKIKKTADRSFENVAKVLMFGKDTQKSKLHSQRTYKQVTLGE